MPIPLGACQALRISGGPAGRVGAGHGRDYRRDAPWQVAFSGFACEQAPAGLVEAFVGACLHANRMAGWRNSMIRLRAGSELLAGLVGACLQAKRAAGTIRWGGNGDGHGFGEAASAKGGAVQ